MPKSIPAEDKVYIDDYLAEEIAIAGDALLKCDLVAIGQNGRHLEV